jgi:hypothetical protein
MLRRSLARAAVVICISYCLLPAASAQSAIIGVVQDSGGGCCPVSR